MGLNREPKIVGNRCFFFRDGAAYTVPSAGTAGRSSKPGAADTSWIDFGIVREASVNYEREEIEIFAPTPGRKRLYDVLENKAQLTLTFTTDDFSALAFELLFGTLALTSASTQYNPLEGVVKKGWLKLQQYDQADALMNTVDVFCYLKIGGEINFGDGIVAPQFTARTLHSTLNTGSLA